jgi:CBS domain containing-hemolysin-like protein
VEAIVLIFVCLLGSAFFASSETALLRLRRSEVEAEVEGPRGPASLAIGVLTQSTSRLLVTILLANNVVNVLGAAVASALAVAYLGPELGIAVSTVVMTALLLVFCEVLPKAAAAAHPRRVARLVALPLYLIHQLLRPVHRLFAAAVDPLVRRLAGAREGGATSAEEIVSLVRQAHIEVGAGGAASIISAAARATELTAQEIMVERPHIVAFPVDTSPRELLGKMLEERYTRVPVYEESIDRIVGIVHLKDLVRHVRASGEKVREILRPVLRVPERKLILPLLAEMQQGFLQMAIVKDEHGITQGLLTTEDILEELVGEIRDEYDREELRSIRPSGAESFAALGWVKVVDFNRETGWLIPAEPGDTLGGVVFNELGRAPRSGDAVRVPGYELRVTEVSGMRIARVLVRRLEVAVTRPSDPL